MKCNRFKNEDLRNEEWFQLNTEFKTLVEQYNPATLGIEVLFNKFLPLYANADEALEVIRKSATTEQIAEADNVRDVVFRGFADSVKSAQNHFDSAKRDAAKRIKIVLDKYGNIARKSYDEETASIYNLLQEMNGTYANDIATLGLGDWVSQLEADNKAFDALMQTRYGETSSRTELRMVNVRTETDRCYRDTLDRLDALMLINGDEQYAPFVKDLNTRIDRFSNIIAQRKGRSAAKKEKAAEK